MRAISLLIVLGHVLGVACLQNKARRVADARDENPQATPRSKSSPSLKNGIDFGHPLLPPPLFDLVELYKAPESSKKGNNTHSHSVEFKGPAGEALRLSYKVQFEAGSTVVCLDHLSGIASGSAISHNNQKKESVEVGFKLPKYAEVLMDALEGSMNEEALSTVYITGGMHWGSKDHLDGSARPLLLKLNGFDRDRTTLRLWGSPVGYQDILKDADIRISTKSASRPQGRPSSGKSSKDESENGVKPLELVETAMRTDVIQPKVASAKLSTLTAEWSWWNPLSWFTSAVDAVVSMTENAIKSLGSAVSDVLKGIGAFVWEAGIIVQDIGTMSGSDHEKWCFGWNTVSACSKQIQTKSIEVFHVEGEKDTEAGTISGESTVTCENCYASAEVSITATISIASFAFKSASLQGSGNIESAINMKGDFHGKFQKSGSKQLSESIVGYQHYTFVIAGVPVYLGWRVPLSIGYEAQISTDVAVDAEASITTTFTSGFNYNGDIQIYNPPPTVDRHGQWSVNGAVQAATTFYLMPTIQINLYKFAEVDIALKPGLTLSVDRVESMSSEEEAKACPNSKSTSYETTTTHEVLAAELLMSVSGGINMDWPGIKTYKKMTDPNTMYHNKWPIMSFCQAYPKATKSGASLISGELEAPTKSTAVRYSPKGLHQGQIFGGIFSRLDQCTDDFMPKGQISMTITSVKYAANASRNSCPEEFDIFISANDGTEPNDPDAHACVSVKRMKVYVSPRKELNRCDLRFDIKNARHVHKGCTQNKDKESSCNNFPKLAGSADAKFGIIRLHDEHLRGGEDCIRGIMTRSNIQEAAAECQDSSKELNTIASDRGIAGQHTCEDAEKSGYCGDPDVAQACCNTCIATWLKQA